MPRVDTPARLLDDVAALEAADGATELETIIGDLTAQMLTAAAELKFELAARLRDEVQEMKRELRQMVEAGHVR